jgi:hypothetical protein
LRRNQAAARKRFERCGVGPQAVRIVGVFIHLNNQRKD